MKGNVLQLGQDKRKLLWRQTVPGAPMQRGRQHRLVVDVVKSGDGLKLGLLKISPAQENERCKTLDELVGVQRAINAQPVQQFGCWYF